MLAETASAPSPIGVTEHDLAAYVHGGRDTLVYLDGQFYDRTTETPRQMAEALPARVVRVEVFSYPPSGLALRCQLTRRGGER